MKNLKDLEQVEAGLTILGVVAIIGVPWISAYIASVFCCWTIVPAIITGIFGVICGVVIICKTLDID